MIGLERPLLLGLLGVIAPLLWFLERRSRRRRQITVSSLQIWRRVLATAEVPVRKRRITTRLLLAMATSVGMVGAAVGPYCDPGTGLSRELTVLIDRRPGMGARGTDGRTRLAVGIATLLQGLEQQPSPVRIRLLTVPAMPAVSAMPAGGVGGFLDEPQWKIQLRSLVPATRSGDFASALASLDAFPGPRMVVTDESPPAEVALRERFLWLSVGEPEGDNLGFVWAQAVPTEKGERRLDLSLGILNGGARSVTRRIFAQAGRREVELAVVHVAPGAVWIGDRVPVPLEFVGQPFAIRLDGSDQLAVDDQVWFRPVVAPEIFVVSTGPVPVAVTRAVHALGARPVHTNPERALNHGPAVFWKCWPPPGVRPSCLVVAPAQGAWETMRSGPDYSPQALRQGPGWSEVGGVAPYPTQVSRARRIQGYRDWTVALNGVDFTGEESPLILHRDGITVLAFDPVQEAGAFPEQDAFPALFFRAIGRAGESYVVEGLLQAEETRLGRVPTSWPLDAELPSKRRPGPRESWGAWFLLAALMALVGIYRLDA